MFWLQSVTVNFWKAYVSTVEQEEVENVVKAVEQELASEPTVGQISKSGLMEVTSMNWLVSVGRMMLGEGREKTRF